MRVQHTMDRIRCQLLTDTGSASQQHVLPAASSHLSSNESSFSSNSTSDYNTPNVVTSESVNPQSPSSALPSVVTPSFSSSWYVPSNPSAFSAPARPEIRADILARLLMQSNQQIPAPTTVIPISNVDFPCDPSPSQLANRRK